MNVMIVRTAVFVLTLMITVPAWAATCFLKQSTAADVGLGPFVDNTDGFTAETALTISQADVRLKKTSGNWAQKNETTSCTHEENGWYECPLNSTDTNTLGALIIAVNESGALPVWKECVVLPANAYDALISGSGAGVRADIQTVSIALPANITNSGTAQAGCTPACATITLATSASTVASYYVGQTIQLTGGTGGGQTCTISAYSTGRVATCTVNWATAPDGTTTYAVIGTGPTSATVSGNVTVGGYAANQSPADLVLVTPANKLTTDASGRVQIQAGTGTGQLDLSSGRLKDDKPAVVRLAYRKGTTNLVIPLYVEDQRTGGPLTGLAFNAASLTCYFARSDQGNNNATVITLVAGTRGSYLSGGLIEKDATNSPGVYELGVPSAVIASGSPWAVIECKGAANMKPAVAVLEIADDFAGEVWNVAVASHLTAGSTGEKVNAAASAGDPWTTALPGSYGAGTAGKKIGDLTYTTANRVDATIVTPSNFSTMLINGSGYTTAGGTYRKNVASQKYPVYMTDASGNPVTGSTLTVKVSKDGATGVTISGSVAQIDSTNLPGWYAVTLAAGDTNCDLCTFVATGTGGARPRAFFFTTAP